MNYTDGLADRLWKLACNVYPFLYAVCFLISLSSHRSYWRTQLEFWSVVSSVQFDGRKLCAGLLIECVTQSFRTPGVKSTINLFLGLITRINSEILVSQLPLLWHCMKMSGQLHALPFYLGQRAPCTRGLGAMVGPTFVLAADVEKFLPLLGYQISIPWLFAS
jgi:hypothetical protein